MSDANIPIEPLWPHELAALHRELGVRPKCWVCGTDSWRVISSPSTPAVTLPMRKNYADEAPSETVVGAYALSCKRCGTIWLIDERFMAARREELPDVPGAPE